MTIKKHTKKDFSEKEMSNGKLIGLDVLIISYNTLKLLSQCLKTLYNILEMNFTINVHLYIVDNASEDGTVEFVASKHPEINIIKNNVNLGYAKAVNIGIKAGRSPFILVLNSDLQFRDHRLSNFIEYMDNHNRVGIAGPQLLYEDGRWQKSYEDNRGILSSLKKILGILYLKKCFDKYFYRWNFYRPKSVGMVPGAVMLIRRSMVEEIGDLDENFFFYGEDAEFCYRARKHGYKVIFFPKFYVTHLKGGSTPDFFKSLKKILSADALLMKKNYHNSWYRRIYGILELIVALIRYMALKLLLLFYKRQWIIDYSKIMKTYIRHYMYYIIKLAPPQDM